MARDLLQNFNDGREYMQKAYDSGGWFLVHQDLFLALGIDEAVLMSCLISINTLRDRFRNDKGLKSSSWFKCSEKDITSRLKLDASKQRRILRKLKAIGLIETTTKGLPAKRFLQINYAELGARIQQGNQK